MRPRGYLFISAVVFAVVAAAHLTRLIIRWPIEMAGWSAPHWLSVPGLVVPGLLSAWGFLLARHEHRPVEVKKPEIVP